MKVNRIGLSYSSRSCMSGATALVGVLVLGLSGMIARAQAVPPVVVSQATSLAPFPAGGALSSQNAAGSSFAVNSNGDIITGNTYGNQVLLISGKTGVVTVLGSYSNVGPVTLDSQNNLYVGGLYNAEVIKVPYVNGTYAAVSAPTSATSPAVCTGTDTTECNFGGNLTNAANGYYFGLTSIAFDSQGDFFFATTNANHAPNAIFECTVACLSTGTPAATLLYQEPTGSPATTGQLNIGGIAVDASGNLFFTDSSLSTAAANESTVSHLNELAYTAGTAYAATPIVLETLTPPTPGQYDDELDAVAIGPNGTVYFATQDDGVFALPNNGGTINTANVYGVSTQAAKEMAVDASGNVYVVTSVSTSPSSSVDTMFRITSDAVTAPATVAGTPSTATNVVTMLNDVGCTATPTVTYTAASGGTATTVFSAATTAPVAPATTSCVAQEFGSGSSLATTVTFSPAVVGVQTATLTATDSHGGIGAAALTGNATGTVTTPTFSPVAGTFTSAQTVTISDATGGATIFYTTDGSTPTINSNMYASPIAVSATETLSAIAVGTGDTNSAVGTALYTINLVGVASTPTFSIAAGTYTTPQLVALSDATAGAVIYYTTDGSTPSASSTLYSGPIAVTQTETVSAIAVVSGLTNSSVGSALYTINLPPSAFQNVVLSQSIQLGALPGGGAQSGGEPAGDTMAVNGFGNLIATNTYNNQILLFTPQGTTATVLGSLSNPNGVAVDSQNNLYIGFSYGPTVVKIPYVNGAYAAIAATSGSTPNCTGTDAVECIMNNVSIANGSGVVSMVFDAEGDLFFGTTNQNQGGNNPNTIYECTAACLYTGAPAPKVVFTEPTASAPNTTGQLSIGGMAIDGSGNLFFTDSAIGTTNNQESFTSNVNELPYTSGTGYAASPTVIYTYAPITPANYDSEIDGVATSPNGTIYALLQNTTGILAFPKVSGSYSNTNMYVVSTQSGKLLTGDALGNLYEADNNSNVYEIAVDNITAPTSPVQNPATATNVTTFLNDGGCTATPPTVTFAFTGASASAYSAATTGACTTTVTGASFATSVTFSPISVGANSATVTATDSLSNTGTASVSGTGTPAPPAATPTFSVAAGTYTTVQTVSISDTSTNAAIYYTLDGSTPTSTSTVYSGPLTVGTTETLNAIATGNGFATSPVATALYTINLPTVATPTFSVTAGTYTSPQTVTITDVTAGAAIYYTTNGSTPTASSTPYAGAITVSATETVNAIAIATNYNNSAIASAAYTINLPAAATPTFSVAGGPYASVQTVSISDATTGSTIYYTVDGSTPAVGAGSTALYSGPITVAVSTTINALAVAPPDYNISAVGSAAYIINLPATSFSITSADSTITVPAGGTGTATLTLTANASFNGSISFACAGFLPIGASCAFSPTSVALVAQGNSTTTLTVKVPASTAAVHHGPGPLLPGSMMAVALSLLGFRKRRRLQMVLVLLISGVGMTMFSGCTTTSSSTASSSQIVVTATGASCPYDTPGCTPPTQVVQNLNLVLTVQ